MKARETAETLRVRSFQCQKGEPNSPQRRYPQPSIIPVTIPACWTAPDGNDNLPPTTPTSDLRSFQCQKGEPNSPQRRYPQPSIIPVTIPACWTAPDGNDNLPPTTPTS